MAPVLGSIENILQGLAGRKHAFATISEPESIPEAVSLWVRAHTAWSGAELGR